MPTSTEIKEARVRSNPMVNNLLINPGFEVWQRGTGPFTSAPGFRFTTDEWRNMTNSGTMSVSQSSASLFGDYCASLTNTGKCQFGQGIEQYKGLSGKWVTFSCWVKAAIENDVRLWIRNNAVNGGGDNDAIISESVPHPGDGQWHQLCVTTQLQDALQPSASTSMPHGFGLQVSIRSTIDVTGVLIDGAVLTEGYYPEGVPFVPPNPAEDLERCQWFYQESGGDPYNGSIFRQDVVSGSNYFADHFFQTPMYATPTLTITNGNNVGFGASPAGTQVDRKGFKEYRTATATAASRYFWSYWEAEVS